LRSRGPTRWRLRDVGHLGDAARPVARLESARRAVSLCLSERGERELASDRAREAIEELQRAPSLREEEWLRLGVPLMASWASEEAACGRGSPRD
jgi:hypothetical protein